MGGSIAIWVIVYLQAGHNIIVNLEHAESILHTEQQNTHILITRAKEVDN